jgi:hypothetical protein
LHRLGDGYAIIQAFKLCRGCLVQIIDLARIGRDKGPQGIEFLGRAQLFGVQDLADLLGNGHGLFFFPALPIFVPSFLEPDSEIFDAVRD